MLNGLVSELRAGLGDDLVAVVLFGSRARGEAHEGSDWDVLVVANGLLGRTLERAIQLKRMLPDAYRGQVSLLAKTLEEFLALAATALSLLVAGMGGGSITGRQHAAYRLKLAQGFLEEARQDTDLSRWRSAVDSAQLAVENAGKTILVLFGRIGRIHNPATQIRHSLNEGRLGAALSEPLERLQNLPSFFARTYTSRRTIVTRWEGARPGSSSTRKMPVTLSPSLRKP